MKENQAELLRQIEERRVRNEQEKQRQKQEDIRLEDQVKQDLKKMNKKFQ